MAELVNAAATAKACAARISNLHDIFDEYQREMRAAVPRFPGIFWCRARLSRSVRIAIDAA